MSRLAVWIGDRHVGSLIRKPNGNLQFRYEAGYDGPPVSQCLPVQPTAHQHRAALAVFGGLLPEGHAREALAHNLGISRANDYALLEAVGGDVAGAITLLPDGELPPGAPTTQPLDVAGLARLLDELPQRPLASGENEGIRLSLAGAQPKVPVIQAADGSWAVPTNSAAPTTHILKPEPDRFPGLVDNEGFCMALAQACGLVVAPVRKAVSATGRPFLIVERYDRDLTVEPIRRLHQEDFCQALGFPADQKYQAEGGPTFRDAAALVRRCTPVPAQELPRLVRALIFHWIVGNCDAHGKNYSLLYDHGAPTFAPLYDVVSTVIYPELTDRLAMSIGGARRLGQVSAAAWAALAKDAAYRPAFVEQAAQALVREAAVQSAVVSSRTEHDNPTAARIAQRVQVLAAAR